MKYIDFFSGIGGFTRGMELAGHERVGHCEIDPFAEASFRSMHCITDEQREYLLSLPLKERQKEILKEEYLNGEFYASDIKRVYAGDIPKADCWCFGFPCQDISIAGKQLGFTGSRSSLFFRIMYLLGQLEEKEKPEWLFIENVKNLLSVNGGWDFARLLVELERGGMMQNGKFLTANTSECLRTENAVLLSDILETEVPQKYFLSKEQTERIIFTESDTEKGTEETCKSSAPKESPKLSIPQQGGGRGHHTIEVIGKAYERDDYGDNRNRILGVGGVSPSLTATQYKEPYRIGLSLSEILTLRERG